MYTALLSDLSRSLLNIPLEPEDFLTKVQEVAGPRTPDNEELSGGQRTGHERAHLTAVPPDGCPVDFSALFVQPTGVSTGTAMDVPSPSPAAEAHAPAVAPSGAAVLLTATHSIAAGAVGGRDPDSRDYSTWSRSEENQFYAVLVSHSCHTVKTVCDVARQRIGTKSLPQVKGFYKRAEKRMQALLPAEDRTMLSNHQGLKFQALTAHWSLMTQAVDRPNFNSRRLLEYLKAENLLPALHQQLVQEVAGMRAGAQAEEEKVAAARARTAATQAFNRLPFHTRRQLGGVPPPTTEALREAILQRTCVSAIPPSSPQPALAPPALTPPTVSASAPVAAPASAPAAAGAPVAAVVGDGRPASAVVTESQAQLRSAYPSAVKEQTASATVGQHLPQQRLGPPGVIQPEAAPARLETALLPVSSVVGSQRHIVRFMPRSLTDQAAAAAVGASPFIELVNLKGSKAVAALAAHLHKKWCTDTPPSLYVTAASPALGAATLVGQLCPEAQQPTVLQLLYGWPHPSRPAAQAQPSLRQQRQQQPPPLPHQQQQQQQQQQPNMQEQSPQHHLHASRQQNPATVPPSTSFRDAPPLQPRQMSSAPVTAVQQSSPSPNTPPRSSAASLGESAQAGARPLPALGKRAAEGILEQDALPKRQAAPSGAAMVPSQPAASCTVRPEVTPASDTPLGTQDQAASSPDSFQPAGIPPAPKTQKMQVPPAQHAFSEQRQQQQQQQQQQQATSEMTNITSPVAPTLPGSAAASVLAPGSTAGVDAGAGPPKQPCRRQHSEGRTPPAETTSTPAPRRSSSSRSAACAAATSQPGTPTASRRWQRGAASPGGAAAVESGGSAFADLFGGSPALPTAAPPQRRETREAAERPVEGPVPSTAAVDPSMGGLTNLFVGGGLSSVDFEDSFAAFAAAGLQSQRGTDVSSGAPGRSSPQSKGGPAAFNLRDLLFLQPAATQGGNADMAGILERMCTDGVSNMALPPSLLHAAGGLPGARLYSPLKAARGGVAGASSPGAMRSLLMSPPGRSRLGLSVSRPSPIAFGRLGSLPIPEQAGGADLAGGGLSQLELDVGSLLGVGDDNSWDRPPARPAAAPAAPRTASGVGGGPRPAPTAHDPGTTLSAFHELFPASHSAGDSKNGA